MHLCAIWLYFYIGWDTCAIGFFTYQNCAVAKKKFGKDLGCDPLK